TPHPWLNSDSNRITSCQEYVYRKWDASYTTPSVSAALDNGAACGANGDCLMDGIVTSSASPFLSGNATLIIPAAPARPNTNVPINWRQNVTVGRNPFYAVATQFLYDQEIPIREKLNGLGAYTCDPPLQGPFNIDPVGWKWFAPTSYT